MRLVVFLLFLTACAPAPELQLVPPTLHSAIVTRIVDGDTVVIGEEHVRIIGIDTPEKEECYFDEASERLSQLIFEKSVERIPEPTDNRDKYGRLLRYIELSGEDIGLQMLKEGFAENYPWFPHPRIEEYKEAEDEAKKEGRGLWGEC
ncbi:MAG: thermonuclease family protein [bacterium]|nr:thermonuclease family protein [bacterium]MDA1292758.1 thermonuclease family protein [bacterium]